MTATYTIYLKENGKFEPAGTITSPTLEDAISLIKEMIGNAEFFLTEL